MLGQSWRQIIDWSIHGTAPDGTEICLEGTATDVARRGQDGFWRYIIDKPIRLRVALGVSLYWAVYALLSSGACDQTGPAHHFLWPQRP